MKKTLIFLLLLFSSVAYGQLSLINVGTAANDGTGDPLRTAFQKVNLGITQINTNTTAIALKAPLLNATLTGTTNINILKVGGAGNVGVTAITSDGVNIHFWDGVTELAAVPGLGGATWGTIVGTLANQVDLNIALGLKSPLASPTFTGTVTIPTPFTLGAVSVTSTGTQLNYLSTASGTTGTGSLVLSASPTITGHPTIEGITPTGATGTGNMVFSISPTFTGTPVVPGYVPTSRTVNGHALTGNVSVTAADAAALALADTAAMLGGYARDVIVNGKLNISDTTVMLNNYARQWQLDSVITALDDTLDLGTIAIMTADSSGVDEGSYTSGYDFANDGYYDEKALHALGATYVGKTICTTGGITGAAMADNVAYYCAAYVPKSGTTTGVRALMIVAGDYISNNYNGFALYSVSGGTYTLIDSTVSGVNVWKATANSIIDNQWHSTHLLAPGVYMIGFMYNNSAQTVAPQLAAAAAVSRLFTTSLTNSNDMAGAVGGQNSFPASEAGSDVAVSSNQFAAILY